MAKTKKELEAKAMKYIKYIVELITCWPKQKKGGTNGPWLLQKSSSKISDWCLWWTTLHSYKGEGMSAYFVI